MLEPCKPHAALETERALSSVGQPDSGLAGVSPKWRWSGPDHEEDGPEIVIPVFKKYLLSIYYMPGTALGPGVLCEENRQIPSLMRLQCGGQSQEMRTQCTVMAGGTERGTEQASRVRVRGRESCCRRSSGKACRGEDIVNTGLNEVRKRAMRLSGVEEGGGQGSRWKKLPVQRP